MVREFFFNGTEENYFIMALKCKYMPELEIFVS